MLGFWLAVGEYVPGLSARRNEEWREKARKIRSPTHLLLLLPAMYPLPWPVAGTRSSATYGQGYLGFVASIENYERASDLTRYQLPIYRDSSRLPRWKTPEHPASINQRRRSYSRLYRFSGRDLLEMALSKRTLPSPSRMLCPATN